MPDLNAPMTPWLSENNRKDTERRPEWMSTWSASSMAMNSAQLIVRPSSALMAPGQNGQASQQLLKTNPMPHELDASTYTSWSQNGGGGLIVMPHQGEEIVLRHHSMSSRTSLGMQKVTYWEFAEVKQEAKRYKERRWTRLAGTM
jgi:hypothetical protein